jgi:formylglycine-generating enzyme required for sulfatase activity
MTNVADAQKWREMAEHTVERFVRRFDESYRLLAYHAALPLVLTPELVNYLRNQFLRSEKVPWVAEIDLLLSDLCSQVSYELFAMDTHVRAYLLEEMEKNSRFGKKRMQEVARVLYSYVNYLSRVNPGRRQQELEAQRWAAMVYLGDKQCKEAVREITQKLIEISHSDTNFTNFSIRAELSRLTRITQELSPQLKSEPGLLEYARLTQQVLRTPEVVNLAEINHSRLVDGRELPSLGRFLPSMRTEISEGDIFTKLEGFPPIQTFEFEVVTITIEYEADVLETQITPATPVINLQPFHFEVATIELKESAVLQQKIELIVKQNQQQAQYFVEDLGQGVQLEMVSIPKGKFLMGAPKEEKESKDNERPLHPVTIKPFFMGKYPITQAQWRVVALLPRIKKELKHNPSNFKGDNRPVERVSWSDAVEFCERLSLHTNRLYRLPSEAEWEYACRAGTTTPFHFGETIKSELANYNARYAYGVGVKGIYRSKTTNVGSFGVANGFGLYDMHGNVLEWCADHWHSSYEGAPQDGSAWLDNDDNQRRVLRGGSWYRNPVYCRSACRDDNFALSYTYIGFRIACGV